MSDLVARIGVRKGCDANPSNYRKHIKELPVNDNPPSSVRHPHHHSKYATPKYEPPFPTGSPSHAPFPASDSQPPSLLSRLDPIHVDWASSRGDTVVPLIDRIFRTKEDNQYRELSSSMENPIIAEAPVPVTPYMSAIRDGSFANVENATSPLRNRSSEQIIGKPPMSLLKTSAQSSRFFSTPTSQESRLPIHQRLHPSTGVPLNEDSNIHESRNRPRSPTPTIISKIRDVLLPLVMLNTQLRPAYETEKAHLEKIRDKAQEILTDEACESFVGRMQSIERQIQARTISGREIPRSFADVETDVIPNEIASTPSLAGPLSTIGSLPVPSSSTFPHALIELLSSNDHQSSLPTPPVSAPLPNNLKAPKAMRLHEFVYSSPQQIRQTSPRPPSRKGKEKAGPYELLSNSCPPRPQSHVDGDVFSPQIATSVDPDVHDSRLQSPGPSGTAILIDSGFFEQTMNNGAEGGSVSPSRHRSSSFGSQLSSSLPPHRFGHSPRRRISCSPDGYRPRMYHSPGLNDHMRQLSHGSRSRSHSPDRSIPYSPKSARYGRELDHSSALRNSSRILVGEGTRRRSPYRSNSRSRSRPRLRLSRSPEHRRFDHFPNRVRRHNLYRSKSRSHSRNHSASRSPQPLPRHFAHDPTPSDQRRRDFSHPLTMINYPSYTSHNPRSRSGSRRHSYSAIHGGRERENSVNDIVYGSARPPEVENAISNQSLCNTRSLAQIMEPCRNVPGLWFVKMGEEGVRIMECEIDIDHETSLKWNLAHLSKLESVLHVQPQQRLLSLKLMCIPTQVIRSTYETLGLSTGTSEEIATKLFDLENEWPRKGTLVVAVNPHKAWGKTWLPIDLEPSSSALDLTTCICEGTNVVRFIQLADMAEKVFILCAILPAVQDPDEEHFRDLSKHLAMSPGPLKLHPAVVEVA